MRRLLLMTGCATLVAATACSDITVGSTAYAARQSGNTLVGGDITATLDEAGDFRMTGADVTVRGRVGGQLSATGADFHGRSLEAGALHVAAADVVFDGQVQGNANVTAADVVWRGAIGGDARFRAADLEFAGSVDGDFDAELADAVLSGRFADMTLAAADLVLGADSRVTGDFYADAADIDLRGWLEQGADIQARSVRVSGDIAGPVVLNVNEALGWRDRNDGLVEISGRIDGGTICARRVVITGDVTGALTVMAEETPELGEGARTGDVSFIPRSGRRCERA